MGDTVSNKEKILKGIGWVCIAGLIAGIIVIAIRGKMFTLWYNLPLFIGLFLVVAVIVFWIYVAVKGIDNVMVEEKRSMGDPLEAVPKE